MCEQGSGDLAFIYFPSPRLSQTLRFLCNIESTEREKKRKKKKEKRKEKKEKKKKKKKKKGGGGGGREKQEEKRTRRKIKQKCVAHFHRSYICTTDGRSD